MPNPRTYGPSARPRVMAIAFILTSLVCVPRGWTQATPIEVKGQIFNSLANEPVAEALVQIEELKLEARTDKSGAYVIPNVTPGRYHFVVSAQGFVKKRTELEVGPALSATILIDPELHYSEVVSVSPDPRSAFESYQPTTVLAGQELARELQGTIGAALEAQPGVASRSFGPGPARPVIRGLDGDRVLILEDGQRMGDLSSQSGDHGVNVNPAAASRIEVVRGPATLLYGANAIGGLVNVISKDIPTERVNGATGNVTFDAGTAASEAGGAADVSWGNGNVAIHAGGSGRRSGDVDTPEGKTENTQSRGGFGNFGISKTGEHNYIGFSYGYDDTRYGIPLVEQGDTVLTPRRHSFNFRTEYRELGGFISSIRASAGVRRYKHDEIAGGMVDTSFTNNTGEVEGLANHRAAGRLKGSFGAWAMGRSFAASGEEALSPPVDQRAVAGFVYEEVTWPHVTFQFGGRVDHTAFRPSEGLTNRDFNNFSGSVGLVLHPRDAVSIAVSLARAARNPALEELYFNGPHAGNFAFEIGNPDLGSEHAFGVDVSLRWQHRLVSGEVTYFRNDIRDYIFRNPTGEIDEEEGFPVIRFAAADSLLQGIESHLDANIAANIGLEAGLDYVRGELKDTGDPLPRMPPLRGRFGLRYHRNALQVGGDVTAAAKQDRVFGAETPTDGYQLLKLFGSYSFGMGRAVQTITLRLDNATNELYRNHLSLIKDFVPEMGRNFKVVYSVRF